MSCRARKTGSGSGRGLQKNPRGKSCGPAFSREEKFGADPCFESGFRPNIGCGRRQQWRNAPEMGGLRWRAGSRLRPRLSGDPREEAMSLGREIQKAGREAHLPEQETA